MGVLRVRLFQVWTFSVLRSLCGGGCRHERGRVYPLLYNAPEKSICAALAHDFSVILRKWL